MIRIAGLTKRLENGIVDMKKKVVRKRKPKAAPVVEPVKLSWKDQIEIKFIVLKARFTGWWAAFKARF